MRNWIVLVGIALSFTLVAQKSGNKGGNKEGNKGNTQGSQQGNKNDNNKGNGNKSLKPNGGQQKMNQSEKNGHSGPVTYQKHQSKFKYKKGHMNHAYMYSYSPFNYPTKNYGQWRSQQARNKHNAYHPVLQIDLLDAILMIRERNTFLFIEIDNKIDRYNRLVIDRHNRGLISDVDFSVHLGTVKMMKKRRGYYDY